MKPHLTRCAIGGACAALMFMLVTASPAFADGAAEHGSAAGHGSSHENVFGGRDPDGESSGTPASRVRSDPTEEPTSPAHANPAESQPADSPKCAPRAEATTVIARRGGEFVPAHEDVDAAPIANLPDVAVPALPSNPPDEPVVTPTPGRVAVPVAVSPTPSGAIAPAPAETGGATLAFAVLPAAPIEPLVPANAPAGRVRRFGGCAATPGCYRNTTCSPFGGCLADR